MATRAALFAVKLHWEWGASL